MTTTTTRRSTSGTYVAVRCETKQDMIHCTAIKDMTIDATIPGVIATNDAKVELKAGDEFYLVRSDSLVDEDDEKTMFYVVKVITGHKRCSCPARKPCKHEIAVQAKVDQRRAEAKAATSQPSPKVKVTVERGPVATRLTDMLSAPLNGQRGFSMMRR